MITENLLMNRTISLIVKILDKFKMIALMNICLVLLVYVLHKYTDG